MLGARVLTGFDKELVRDARVVYIVNGTGKYSGQHLQIGEYVLE